MASNPDQYWWPPLCLEAAVEEEQSGTFTRNARRMSSANQLMDKNFVIDNGEEDEIPIEQVTYATQSMHSESSVPNDLMSNITEQKPSSNSKNGNSSNNTRNFNISGTSCLVFNHRAHVFALGEKGLNPRIHVYSYSRGDGDMLEFQYRQTLFDATTVEFNDLAFSRDGKYLVALGAIPDCNITVWHWEEGACLALSNASEHSRTISFNPRNANQLCSTGVSGHIQFWTLDSNINGTYHLSQIEAVFAKTSADTRKRKKGEAYCHCWGLGNDIWVGSTTGEVYHFSSMKDEGQLLQDAVTDEPILAILVTKHYFIMGSNDGILRFYSNESLMLTRKIILNSNELLWQFKQHGSEEQKEPFHESVDIPNKITGQEIRSLLFTEDSSEIICSTSDGAIFKLISLNEPDDNNNPSQSRNGSSHSAKESQATLLYDSHVGIVTGLVHLPGTNLIVSCGEDGTVRMFDIRSNSLVHKIVFNCSFTSLSYTTAPNLDDVFYIVLGTQLGYIHVMELKLALGTNGENSDVHCALLCHLRVRKSTALEVKCNVWDQSTFAVSYNDSHMAFLYLDFARVVKWRELRSEESQSESIASPIEDDEIRLLSDGLVTLRGFIRAPLQTINTFEWKNKSQLFVSIGDDGVVVEIDAPGDASKRVLKINEPENFDASMGSLRFYFDFQDLAYDAYKLDFPAYGIAALKESPDNFYTLSKDKKTKFFRIVAASEDESMDYHVQARSKPTNGFTSLRTISFPDDIDSHFKIGNCIQVSNDGKFLATGARDGLVWLRTVDTRLSDQRQDQMDCDLRALHDPTLGGASRVCFTNDNRYLCSAGYDGSIFVHKIITVTSEQGSSNSLNNDLLPSIDFSYNQSEYPPFSFGPTPIQQSIIATYAERLSKNLEDQDIYDGFEEESDPSFFEVEKKRIDDSKMIIAQSHKSEMADKFAKLQAIFTEIEHENMGAPESERLSADELIIDKQYEEEEDAKSDERVAEYKKQIEYGNLRKEILLQRIKKECWDPMEQHQIILKSFGFQDERSPHAADVETKERKTGEGGRGGEAEAAEVIEAPNTSAGVISVANYVIQKMDQKRKTLVGKIRFMRRIEEIDMQHRRPYFYTFDLEGRNDDNVEYDYNAGSDVDQRKRPPKRYQPLLYPEESDRVTHRLDAADSNRTSSSLVSINSHSAIYTPTDAADITTDNEKLLFSPFDLYTRQRKINQMQLIKARIAEMKKDFNGEFDDVHKLKKQTVQKIAQGNEKVLAVLEELDMLQQIKEIQKQLEEEDETKVNDKQLQQQHLLERKESEKMREKKHQEHLYHPKVFHEENFEDYLLNLKPEEITFEPWISPEDSVRMEEEKRTEEERIRLEQGSEAAERALFVMMNNTLERKTESFAHDAETLKKREEEEMKKQKQLEARLRNCKQEIRTLCDRFDARLTQLLDKRVATDQVIHEMELQAIKLSQIMMESEDREKKLNEMSCILEEMKEKNAGKAITVQNLEKQYEAVVLEKSHLEKEEETLTSTFRSRFALRDVPPQHQESILDRLFRLYRTKARFREPNKQEVFDLAQKNPDPFADIEVVAKLSKLDEEQQVLLDPPVDNSTGQKLVSGQTWNEFLQEKRIKYDVEKRLYQISEKEKTLRTKLEHLKEQLANSQSENSKLSNELEQYVAYLSKEAYNLDKVFHFKQGQVEVEQQVVVTDYSDAILISDDVITRQSKEILKIGQRKIEQMQNLRRTQREILSANWNNEMMDFEAEEESIKYKRLQMLRVTKEMQGAVRAEGWRHDKEADRKRLETQINNTQESLHQKVAVKREKIRQLEKQSQRLMAENLLLKDQVQVLENLVQEREQILSMQPDAKDKKRADKKMREMAMERRLKDLSKAQETEMQFLQKETGRLRERSYPSFAVVSRRKL